MSEALSSLVIFVAGADDYTLTDAFPQRMAAILRRYSEEGLFLILRCMKQYAGSDLLKEMAEDFDYGFAVAENEREVMDSSVLIYFDDGNADQEFLAAARGRVRVRIFQVGGTKRLHHPMETE